MPKFVNFAYTRFCMHPEILRSIYYHIHIPRRWNLLVLVLILLILKLTFVIVHLKQMPCAANVAVFVR